MREHSEDNSAQCVKVWGKLNIDNQVWVLKPKCQRKEDRGKLKNKNRLMHAESSALGSSPLLAGAWFSPHPHSLRRIRAAVLVLPCCIGHNKIRTHVG